MTFRATFAVSLAVTGVVAVIAVCAAAVAGGASGLILGAPLAICAAGWVALHGACASPSRTADAGLLVVLVAMAGGCLMLVSFGGMLAAPALPFFACSAIALPRG